MLNEEFGKNFSCKFLTHIGSPYYVAPEINTLGFYSESVDIWGIGLILAYSRFGEAFFKKDKKVKGTEEESDSTDSEDNEECEDRESFVSRIENQFLAGNTDLSPDFSQLLIRMLSLDPEQRPSAR